MGRASLEFFAVIDLLEPGVYLWGQLSLDHFKRQSVTLAKFKSPENLVKVQKDYP